MRLYNKPEPDGGLTEALEADIRHRGFYGFQDICGDAVARWGLCFHRLQTQHNGQYIAVKILIELTSILPFSSRAKCPLVLFEQKKRDLVSDAAFNILD